MSSYAQTTKLRLYPDPCVLAGEEGIYQGIDLQRPTSPTLPYVLMNMVCSVDGRSSVEGRASGIGSRADRGAMRALRSRVDAVMVGAGTIRAEKLNVGLDDPEARQPLAVVVGGTGDLPITECLVGGRQDVVLVLPEGSPDPGDAGRGPTTVLRAPTRGGGRADLSWLLEVLRSEYGVERLLVEGGPTLNRALIEESLVDELFLTIASKLLLGPESAILTGAPGVKQIALALMSVHSADDELFLRYSLRNPG
jgi:2,5-diamino-6-(ribosylamino)-4(3H)-pyrimidinone 5'-phosphate reductase